VVTIAPCYPIAVFDPDDTGIITVLIPPYFRVIAEPFDWIVVKLPINAIIAESAVKVHLAFLVIASKNTRKFAVEKYCCAVKNTIRGWDQVPWNDRVGTVTPKNIGTSCWTIFPRDVGEISDFICFHIMSFFL
jgi:hypothetical protein